MFFPIFFPLFGWGDSNRLTKSDVRDVVKDELDDALYEWIPKDLSDQEKENIRKVMEIKHSFLVDTMKEISNNRTMLDSQKHLFRQQFTTMVMKEVHEMYNKKVPKFMPNPELSP